MDLELATELLATCQSGACPWCDKGFCKLAGKLLNNMAMDRPQSPGSAALNTSSYWLKAKQDAFKVIPEPCIFPPDVRGLLMMCVLPSVLQLATTSHAQMHNLKQWAAINRMNGIDFSETAEPLGLAISYNSTAKV